MTEGRRHGGRRGARRVVVVGGGITGLTAAHRLIRHPTDPPIEVQLMEADDQLGGKIRTVEIDDFPIETGADSFVVRKPWAVELASEVGLRDQLVAPGADGAFVWLRDGSMVPFPARSSFGVPAGLGELLKWRGLPIRHRLRAATDLVHPARSGRPDESLGRLLSRRLGPAAARVLVGPLLAGIHAGDPDRLSVEATFPELRAWEQGHGGLLRGAKRAAKTAHDRGGPMFGTVWGGLSRLVDALEGDIGAERIRRGAPVSELRARGDGGYEVVVDGRPLPADAVVLATPAFESARLLSKLNREAAGELRSIQYASSAVALLVYPEMTDELLPKGTGFIVPIGDRAMTACTWVSRKWPREDYGRRAVLRCFVGRAGSDMTLRLRDHRLIAAVSAEVEAATPIGAAPTTSWVVRWQRSMPQYVVGHLDLLERIDAAMVATPGLFLAGSAYRGVGIADCIHQANESAAAVKVYLGARETGLRPDDEIKARRQAEREADRWRRRRTS